MYPNSVHAQPDDGTTSFDGKFLALLSVILTQAHSHAYGYCAVTDKLVSDCIFVQAMRWHMAILRWGTLYFNAVREQTILASGIRYRLYDGHLFDLLHMERAVDEEDEAVQEEQIEV